MREETALHDFVLLDLDRYVEVEEETELHAFAIKRPVENLLFGGAVHYIVLVLVDFRFGLLLLWLLFELRFWWLLLLKELL